MNDLFQKIVQTTKTKRQTPVEPVIEIQDETEAEMLERHINELFDMISYGFEENVSAAADHGSSFAILCLYQMNARLRGIIPIHDLLVPTDHLRQKLIEYSISGLIDRLQHKFDPFSIGVKKLQEVMPSVGPNRLNMYCVTAEWDIETPDLIV